MRQRKPYTQRRTYRLSEWWARRCNKVRMFFGRCPF